jgi:hypothetical protein
LAGPRRRAQHAPLSVECLVGDPHARGQVGQQSVGSRQIVRPRRRRREPARVAERIDQGVDPSRTLGSALLRRRIIGSADDGAQATPAAPDRLGAAVAFLAAPALCCLRRRSLRERIASSAGDGRARWCRRSARARCRPPPRDARKPASRHRSWPIIRLLADDPFLQGRRSADRRGRPNRVGTFFQAPNRPGRSRHDRPSRSSGPAGTRAKAREGDAGAVAVEHRLDA